MPHDQGNQVFVFWQASARDNTTSHEITNYRVWRRDLIPPSSPARVASSLATFDPRLHNVVAQPMAGPNGVTTITYWELMTTVPAAFLEGYAATEPTVQDSMPRSNPYTAFFIQALTADPLTFYNSTPDSGYSVDNTPPHAPSEIDGALASDGLHLHWSPCPDPDFTSYRVYRGATSDFTADVSHLLAATPDTTFLDSAGQAAFYKVSSLDVHGNESGFASFEEARRSRRRTDRLAGGAAPWTRGAEPAARLDELRGRIAPRGIRVGRGVRSAGAPRACADGRGAARG